MSYIIGCDIGTTSVKSIAFSSDGLVLASSTESYPMLHPKPDWSEQNPELIFNAVVNSINQIVLTLPGSPPPEGISFSAAMHSIMALDKHHAPLSNLIIWADNRSAALAETLRASDLGSRFYQRTGTPIHAMTPLSKLLWIKKENPALFKRADKFIGIKDYIILRLTGQLICDESLASATGIFNLNTRQWDEEILSYLGLSSSKLPDTASTSTQIATPQGCPIAVPPGTPLILGASDGCLANLGSGALHSGSMALTIGTSAAVRICRDDVLIDPAMRTFCYILDEKQFVCGGPSNNGAVIFQWLKDNFFEDFTYEAVFKMAETIAPGCNGLLFLPFLLGERAPLWNAGAKGGFMNMDINHGRKHLVRAVMEGILFNVYTIAKIIMDGQPIEAVHANGGFARSSLWVKMLADILGIPIVLNNTSDAAAAGAALMGFKSLSVINSYDESPGFFLVQDTIQPDQDTHENYRNIYNKFQQTVEILYPGT